MSIEHRPLGNTGLMVSPLGLGTVKWGRNQNLKHGAFELPTDAVLEELLELALAAGVNLMDTAPAYGIAEERVGRLLRGRRDQFVLATKIGEEFADGVSRYDFSGKHTRLSVERSLQRLQTDYLDLVLVHCPFADLEVVRDSPVLETLRGLKERGLLRLYGVSHSTVQAGLLALELSDAVMTPYSSAMTGHRCVIDRAGALGKPVLIKKGLSSGTLAAAGPEAVRASISAVLEIPAVTSLIIGTINPAHLSQNIRAAAEQCQ